MKSKNYLSQKPARKTSPRKLKELDTAPLSETQVGKKNPTIRVSPAVKTLLAAGKKAKGRKAVSKSVLVEKGQRYLKAGLSVIATKPDKTPAATWKEAQTRRATPNMLKQRIAKNGVGGIGIVCGTVSGNLECIDFDSGGEAFPVWAEMVEGEHSGLLKKLVVERSPSGGKHVLYRCPEVAIPGSQKLAVRPSPSPDEHGQTVLIETRGEGGYFVCDPSPGYALFQGSLSKLPKITAMEREALLRCAKILTEKPEATTSVARNATSGNGLLPGDDFARRGDVRELLRRHGWQFVRTAGPNEQWRRPGKDEGVSATLQTIDDAPVFYNFSASAGIPCNRGLSPFQLYAALEHNNDYKSASMALRALGYGDSSSGAYRPCSGGRRFTVPLSNGQTVTITVECA